LQRPIVRILFMVPIYSLDSWLSLRYKEYSLYFNLIRDCYEAYVLYMFFILLVNYFSGEAALVKILENKPPMKHPFPTCFLPKIKLGLSFLRWCKFCVLQFALIKPLDTLVAIVLEVSDGYREGNFDPSFGYLYITIIDNISITISLYFLVLFYLATKEELSNLQPVGKFLCIKAIIFFSFWQGVIIAVLTKVSVIHDVGQWTAGNVAAGLQDFIICLEMAAIAIAHIFAFSYKPFRNPDKTPFFRGILKGEFKNTAQPLLYNMVDSVHPKHDFESAHDVFRPAKEHFAEKISPLLNRVGITEEEINLP